MAQLRHMATEIWVNIDLSSDPMLTYHQRGRMKFTWMQGFKRYFSQQSLEFVWKWFNFKFSSKFPRGQWVKVDKWGGCFLCNISDYHLKTLRGPVQYTINCYDVTALAKPWYPDLSSDVDVSISVVIISARKHPQHILPILMSLLFKWNQKVQLVQ